MANLSNIGLIFYGIAIAGIGFQTIYYSDFNPILLPPHHFWIHGFVILAYISGTMLIVAGACIVFEKKTKPISLLSGGMLLLIFCFYYIPYEFIATSNYMDFGEWENAVKELALSSGAFVIAGCFSEKNENPPLRFLRKLISYGTIFFSITIISFGINHFLYAKDVSDYIPSWVPNHTFWTYFAGTALIGSGIAIILKIRPRLIAALLGTMIFIWVIILHIPRAVASPFADMGDEVTSAFLALAYSGIAFVIAGTAKKIA
jgi:uncharacterized membrane protein YphA (DoxX/SURF4 family)